MGVAIEGLTGRNLMTTPLGPPYDLSKGTALPHILAAIAGPDVSNPRDPFHYLGDISEVLHRRFRNLAEQVDFKDSSLTWHIVKSIHHVCDVFAEQIATAPGEEADAARELAAKHLPWHLAFYWVHFSKAQVIDLQTAMEATEALATIALTYIQLEVRNVVESAIGTIGSVAEAYGRLGQLRSPYDIGDLLRPLLCIERFAVVMGDQALIHQIDARTDKVVALFQNNVRAEVGEAIDTRREQVVEELAARPNRLVERDSPEGILAQMLEERGRL